MINFDYETQEMSVKLKQVKGYLDCEKVIIQNIKKHAANGVPVNVIDGYLNKLHAHLQNKMALNKDNINYINFMYAAGFLHTITGTSNWQHWIQAIEHKSQ